ncbi:MAG: hypothetical protein M3R14_05645 [Acidobacteriota bacterium]|nr:hypothetical protein [Acidobacteriota bacterium]
MIEQTKIRVEHYIKQTPTQWLLRIYENAAETITLDSINCKIMVADIYAQVKFEAAEGN